MLSFLLFINTFLWHVGIHFGDSLLGANVVLSLACCFFLAVEGRIRAFSVISFLVFVFVVFYASPVTLLGPCEGGELFRAIASGGIFFLFYLAAFEIGRIASLKGWARLENAAVIMLALGIAGVFVEIALPQLFPGTAEYRSLGKYSGVFDEPSKLATSMAPSLIILMRSQIKKHQRMGAVALVILLVLSKASTLVGIIGLYIVYSIFYVWNWRVYFRVMFLVIGVIVSLTFIDYRGFVEPAVERFVGLFKGTDTSNASSLVYSAGVLDARGNFMRTAGVGTGFNTMGCDPMPPNFIRESLAGNGSGVEYLNRRDGSFLLSKMVSEFGILGVLILFVIWRKFRKIETTTASIQQEQLMARNVMTSLILAFLAAAIVRSTGYFQGSVFLAMMALGGTFRRNAVHVSPVADPKESSHCASSY